MRHSLKASSLNLPDFALLSVDKVGKLLDMNFFGFLPPVGISPLVIVRAVDIGFSLRLVDGYASLLRYLSPALRTDLARE